MSIEEQDEGSIDMDSQPARIQTELTDAECLIHLNLTSRALLPLIHDAIDKGREQPTIDSVLGAHSRHCPATDWR